MYETPVSGGVGRVPRYIHMSRHAYEHTDEMMYGVPRWSSSGAGDVVRTDIDTYADIDTNIHMT